MCEVDIIKIYFFGLLDNVDSSILDVELDKGFKIKSISITKLIKFLNLIEDKREDYYIAEELLMNIYPKYETTDKISKSEDKVFYVDKSIDIDENDKSKYIKLANFHINDYELYLMHTLQLMRLFKEGKIIFYIIFIITGLWMILKRLQDLKRYQFTLSKNILWITLK